MVWAAIGAALGGASKDVEGVEQGITAFAAAILVYAWSMYFYFRRRQAKTRKIEAEEGRAAR